MVLNATQPVCSYWMLVEGVGDCSVISQAALLRYHGCTLENLTLPQYLAPAIPKAEDRYVSTWGKVYCRGVSIPIPILVTPA